MTISKLAGLVLALASGPALALEGFVGADVGMSRSSVSEADMMAGLDDGSLQAGSLDNSDTAFRVFGGLDVNRYLGVELAYTDFGKVNGESQSTGGPVYTPGSVLFEADSTAFSLAAVGRWPLQSGFGAYGKLGMARWSTDSSLRNNALSTGTVSDDGTDPFLALGLSYDLSPSLSLQLEAARYFNVWDYDMDTFTAGVTYRFGAWR